MGIVSRSQGGSGSGSVVSARISRAVAVGGNITLNNIAAYAEVAAATGGPGTGGLDLTIAAASGDVLFLNGTLTLNTAAAVTVFFDVATWVTGAAVNWLGQSAGSNANNGLAFVPSTSAMATLADQYVVQAGDITGGNVVLRLHYLSSVATNRILGRSIITGPLMLSVANFKQ